MIHGHIHHTVEAEMKKQKGKKKKSKVLKQESIPVKVEGLLGDENSQIERGRSVRMAIPYGELAITSSCNIRLTCNQDKGTILTSSRKAMEIIDEILEDDAPFMEDFLRRAT